MKAVDHDRRSGVHLLHRRDVPRPDIGTHGRDAGTDAYWHRLQPTDQRSFQSIGQDRQDMQVALHILRADNRHEVAMALEERDLVNPNRRKSR
jgi:hypothetical protein